MGVNVDGMAGVMEELEDLEDKFGHEGQSWAVGTPANYAVPLEFGSSSYTIKPDGDWLYFEDQDGQLIRQEKVQHPGLDPTPFFRPAIAEVRAKGGMQFIEDNTNKSAEDIESTEEFVQTLAQALAGRIQEFITQKGLVDTGYLRVGTQAVPLNNLASHMSKGPEDFGIDQ